MFDCTYNNSHYYEEQLQLLVGNNLEKVVKHDELYTKRRPVPVHGTSAVGSCQLCRCNGSVSDWSASYSTLARHRPLQASVTCHQLLPVLTFDRRRARGVEVGRRGGGGRGRGSGCGLRLRLGLRGRCAEVPQQRRLRLCRCRRWCGCEGIRRGGSRRRRRRERVCRRRGPERVGGRHRRCGWCRCCRERVRRRRGHLPSGPHASGVTEDVLSHGRGGSNRGCAPRLREQLPQVLLHGETYFRILNKTPANTDHKSIQRRQSVVINTFGGRWREPC